MTARTCFGLWLAFVVAVAEWPLATTAIAQSCEPQFLGAFGGQTRDVTSWNGYVYAAQDRGGVNVLDASDPENPKLVATLPSGGRWTSISYIQARDEMLYALSYWGEMSVWNLAEPERPVLVARTVIPGEEITDFEVRQGVLFLATRHKSLHIIDVRDPSNPIDRGAISDIGWGGAIAFPEPGRTLVGVRASLSGDPVYRVHSIDHSDPTNMRVIDTLEMPDAIISIATREGKAFVSCGEGGLVAIDIRNLTDLRVLGTLQDSGRPFVPAGIELRSDAIIACTLDGYVDVVECSRPEAMRIVGSVRVAEDGRKVSLQSGVAALADFKGSVAFVDVRNRVAPRLVGEFIAPESASDAVVLGHGLLLVADAYRGVYVLDATDPLLQRVLYEVDGVPNAWKLARSGDIAAALTAGGVVLLDVADPMSVVELARFDLPYVLKSLDITPDALVVGHGDYFTLVDITDRANPMLRGRMFLQAPFNSAVVIAQTDHGRVVSLGGWEEIHMYNINDISGPQLLGVIDGVEAVRCMAYAEGYLYAAYEDRVDRYDVRDPAQPRRTAYKTTWGSPKSLEIRDGLLYVGKSNGVDVYDTSRAEQLVERADALSGSRVNNITVGDNWIYLCAEDVRVLSRPDCKACAADYDGDGLLTAFDFVEFSTLFDARRMDADFDGDGILTLFDFLAFQNAFAAGCP